MSDPFDPELMSDAMDTARAMVTAVLVNSPEDAVMVLRDATPQTRFHTTLALASMVACAMESAASAQGESDPLVVWQRGILSLLSDQPD